MRVSTIIQKENSPSDKTLLGVLKEMIQGDSYKRACVAMSYVTIAGIRALLGAFPHQKLTHSQWLVGLDDMITQPGAIELLKGLQNAQVRIATLTNSQLRFHPKVCRLQSVGKGKEVLIVGSANLTYNALTGNSEAVVFLEGQGPAEKELFSRVWEELWAQGHEPTAEELASYKSKYEKSKRIKDQSRYEPTKNKQPPRPKLDRILESDHAELDPSHARICWIECGFITAMGRELELKAEQGLFFGLEPTGGQERMFRFHTSDGKIVTLRMKYQPNHMWRLQMNNNIPEVKRGLRTRGPDGRLGRSDKVAVFTRTDDPDLFNLSFVKLDSRQFTSLEKRSRQSGTVGCTTARSYGWC